MSKAFQVRIGVEGSRRPILAKCADLGAPILVSANSLWNNRARKFAGWQSYQGFDTALDSGGFVAMKLHGGYRWTVEQYVGLAAAMAPAWWAQMDFCCEPEIAADKRTVYRRIDHTVEHLNDCMRVAQVHGIAGPLPVLQGWEPADYCAGPIWEAGFVWPDLVGVGSVCRRSVYGPAGVLAVVAALDKKLPAHVRLHLFGVKSAAIAKVLECFPGRVASTDSMAWNMAARWDAHHAGRKMDRHIAAETMATWYRRQTTAAQDATRQLPLAL